MANLLGKDGNNQDKYLKATGSGTDADPLIPAHTLVSDTGESGLITASLSALRVTAVNLPEVRQAAASALNATIVGAVEVRQSNASALRGTMEVYQSVASAFNATIPAGIEVRQSNASALRATAEIYQPSASALRGTMEIYQAVASALNVTPAGNVASGIADAGNPIKFGGRGLSASPVNGLTGNRVDAYLDQAGRLLVRHAAQGQDNWTATCAPGNGNIRANVTRAAGAAGVRQVITGFTATIVAGSAAPSASYGNLEILDGPSGTNLLFAATLGIPATAGVMAGVNRTGLWIKSSQASAITVQFQSALGANVIESVSVEGTTITE